MPTASDLLLAQDDDGVTLKANTYADIDYFTSYCIMNGKSLVKTPAIPGINGGAGTDPVLYSDDDIAVGLIASRRYMDGRWGSKYIGQRSQEFQSTEWPRQDAYDNSDYYVYGITDYLRDAQCEYGYIALTSGVDLNPVPSRDDSGQQVQRKTTQVGPILDSVTYVNGAAFTDPTYPAADNILRSRGYVRSGSSLVRS